MMMDTGFPMSINLLKLNVHCAVLFLFFHILHRFVTQQRLRIAYIIKYSNVKDNEIILFISKTGNYIMKSTKSGHVERYQMSNLEHIIIRAY